MSIIIDNTVKTKKGKIQNIQREHFLRDDIPCGLKDCTQCSPTEFCCLPAPVNYESDSSVAKLLNQNAQESKNEFTRTTLSQLRPDTPVFIIPDSSVFFDQMDLIETNTVPFANVIVLESVRQEMSLRHYKTYQRINSLISNSGKQLSTILNKNISMEDVQSDFDARTRAFVFQNKHFRQTFIQPISNSDLQLKRSAQLRRERNTLRRKMNVAAYIPEEDAETEDDLEDLSTVTDFGDASGLDKFRKKTALAAEYEEALIVKATKWLMTHFGQTAQVLLLTNDESIAKRAAEVRVPVLSAEEYVNCMKQAYPHLETVLAKTVQDAAKREGSQWIYEPHAPKSEIEIGLKAGKYLKGKFNVDRDYFTQATVSVTGKPRFLIPDFRSMNRAISGDEVIIEVLDPSKWESPRNIIVEDTEDPAIKSIVDQGNANVTFDGQSRVELDAELEKTPKPDDADLDIIPSKEEIAKSTTNSTIHGIVPTAVVVAILSPIRDTYCGSLIETDRKDGRVFFIPVNRCIPRIMINSKDIGSLQDKRLLVTIDNWPVDSRHPNGHIVEVIGTINDTETETKVLFNEFDIRHDRWSKAVEDCLPGLEYTIDEAECEGRVDLRDLNICSIDPPGCTDIDDALHCTRLPDGTYEVGVHIADVTHYMRPGSALDDEASRRSTSVYLVDRRIDMIPARLSTDICSLHEKVDRLAFSCVWKLNKDAEILETRFFKSVIRSKAAFAYADAQERIDLPEEGTDPLTWACRDLMHLARCLKRRRGEEGALTLASSEVKFELDKSRSKALGLGAYKLKEANSLVEEFMLLANVSVARHILRAYPTFALLRRHPTPAPEMLQPLIRACKRWGFDIDISSGKALNDSLDKVQLKGNASFNRIVRMLATRCLTQAVYASAGETTEKQLNHFGLAAPFYTHFTSPIRRYADVVAHRLLATSLGIAPLPEKIKDRANMRDVIDNMNLRHRNAQLASRASTKIWTLKYFSEQPHPVQQKAIILDVKSTGIRVISPELGIECPIQVVKKGEEEAQGVTFDPDTVTLTTGDGKTFTVFQTVMIRITVETNSKRQTNLVVKLIDDSEPVVNPVKLTNDK